MKTIAVISAYNEEKHIFDVVTRTKKYVSDVIVVDDHSSDQTYKLAKSAGAFVLHHRANLGKAGAMKTGCEAAKKLEADVIILMDGDGQHKPEDIPRFLENLRDGVDIVFGSRVNKTGMPLVRKIGTQMLVFLMKFLFQVENCDMQCGYRAFTMKAYPLLKWQSNKYYADAEITARAGKAKLKYKEIPIETIYHDINKGMTIFDGLNIFTKLLIWKITI